MAAEQAVGILLAAGRGRRFDASGQRDKLLALLPSGVPVAVAAAMKLRAAVSRVIAVVRPDADHLAALLRDAGCQAVVCINADEGMGTTLAYAVHQCADANAWLVALADMPSIAPETYAEVLHALLEHDMAAPEFAAQRGHPVGFSRQCLTQLLTLKGEAGARELISQGQIQLVTTQDSGVLHDIDSPADL